MDDDITAEYGNGKCTLRPLIKITHPDIDFFSLYFSNMSLFCFFREYTVVSFFLKKLYYAYDNRHILKNHKTYCTRKCYVYFGCLISTERPKEVGDSQDSQQEDVDDDSASKQENGK